MSVVTERFHQLEQRVAELEKKLDPRNATDFVDNTEVIQQLNRALIDDHCVHPNTEAIVENKSQGETSVHGAGRTQLKLF
ncbi:hypothetical protein Cri9333_0374 [Crinalium epipsammum PCC 9333]|uniref:Uncharacterized protein n=1 Tax=Crinalium epipsammum PCC 9333 TaxID=1173022 RepID=K9VW01_9CYAN|nr:hypothetical protein [Crinalium epipsammum]AFZ11350.1 hypothetical protein Cri9333_0374 [Crinalium epipsammum PCC 9333]